MFSKNIYTKNKHFKNCITKIREQKQILEKFKFSDATTE